MTIILRRNHGGFIESVSEIWGGSGFYRRWFFWNFDGGLFEHLTSQNYEIKVGDAVIQQITRNVASTVKIIFFRWYFRKVVRRAGFRQSRASLAQYAGVVDKLPTRIQTNNKDSNDRNMAWVYIGVGSSRCNCSSIRFE